MAPELRYLTAAQQDLIDLIDWIASDSPAHAQQLIATLESRLGALAKHPDLGRKPRSKRIQELGYRVLVLDDYLAFYKADETKVVIHRVLQGSRSYRLLL